MWGRVATSLSSRRASQASPIGLEISHEWVHLAQWDRGEDAPSLRAVVSLPWNREEPDPSRAPARLRELVAEARRTRPFRLAPVVSAVPQQDVRLIVLNYDAKDDSDDDRAITRLIEERLPESLDRYVIDFVPMRTSGEKHGEKSALVAATPRERILEHLKLLQGAGLEVAALEIEPVAIRRTVTLLAEDPRHENSLIIHCGPERTHVTVLWGRRLVLYRELDFGEAQLVARIAETLQLSPDSARAMLRRYGVRVEKPSVCDGDRSDEPTTPEDISWTLTDILKPSLYGLVDQLNRALVYAASQTHGAPIHNVLLGGLACWPGSGLVLQELLGTPVQTLDPLATLGQVEPAAGVDDSVSRPDAAVALGLALRGMH